MLADFPVMIDYAQVLVQMENPSASGLVWTDEHVAQGFAWSQEHVAFGVPDHDGECRLQVELGEHGALDPQTLWAVQVPFLVTGPVQIGSVFDLHSIALPAGSYALTYQALQGTDGYAFILRLTLSPSDSPGFQILRTGGDLSSNTVLRRDAEPAQ